MFYFSAISNSKLERVFATHYFKLKGPIMNNSWMVLLPPVIVVIMATLTRRIVQSLLVGIISAVLILHNFSVVPAFLFFIKRFWEKTELANLMSWELFWQSSNLFICAFLVILGVLMMMLQHSGASYAYGNFMIKKLTTRGQAERSSLLLSSIFFIDDYFNCLTVGSVMQPIADRFRIPRAKLALLVNVVAAPLAVVVPLSSWVAYILGQLKNAGVSANNMAHPIMLIEPFHLYLNTIPFLFYAIIVLASVWYMTYRHVSYGVLAQHEIIALENDNLFGGKAPITHRLQELSSEKKATASIIDFIFPIAFLFVAVIGWIVCSGGWWVCGGNASLLEAIERANIYAGLFIGSLVATTCSFLFFCIRKKLLITDLGMLCKEGYLLMGGSIITLLCIWTFSSIISQDLKTGEFLAQLLISHISATLLPALFFIMSVLIASLMGTSWGTMGMLIPLALHMMPTFLAVQAPFTLQSAPLFLPVLGAIISGSLVGNHLSPISDVMMMSALSAGAYHIDVLKSHIYFVIPTVLSSTVAFLVAGVTLSHYGLLCTILLSLAAGIITNIFLLHILRRAWKHMQ